MSGALRLVGDLEPRDDWSAKPCSIAHALTVLGSRSSMLILREAFYGTTRFDEFVRRVDISEQVAAARLRELVEHGLLEREPYREPGRRTRHGYRLTEKGSDLFPVLVAFMEWGDRWREDMAGGPVELVHTGCGAHVGVELRCAAGHEVGCGELELVSTPAREA